MGEEEYDQVVAARDAWRGVGIAGMILSVLLFAIVIRKLCHWCGRGHQMASEGRGRRNLEADIELPSLPVQAPVHGPAAPAPPSQPRSGDFPLNSPYPSQRSQPWLTGNPGENYPLNSPYPGQAPPGYDVAVPAHRPVHRGEEPHATILTSPTAYWGSSVDRAPAPGATESSETDSERSTTSTLVGVEGDSEIVRTVSLDEAEAVSQDPRNRHPLPELGSAF